MPYRDNNLGTVIMHRWGSPPKVVPDFGFPRRGCCPGRFKLAWMREIAPLAAGVLLILVLERIDRAPAPREVRYPAAELQMAALQGRDDEATGTVHRIPDSRWP